MYYVVKYRGPFGYIKPWTAVRDSETYSQQFLTPSIIEGMRIKLEVSAILRHRLNYVGMDLQQEQTQSKGQNNKGIKAKGILNRGILLSPNLYLAFASLADAEKASKQHICLCRNEDVLMPNSEILEIEEEAFDTAIHGFELRFEQDNPLAITVGYNRFPLGNPNPSPMKGWVQIVGNPIRQEEE